MAEKGYALSYVPPSIVDGRTVVKMSNEILAASNPMWNSCLVGYYVGKRLPFRMTESGVKNVWGTHLSEVMANNDGFYFFHIPNANFRRKILDNGPITVARVPLILQQWHHWLALKRGQHDSLLVWVRLRSIPHSMWYAPGISAIASAIGKPLYVDLQTEKKRMISYARVCIEIKANQPLCDTVEVLLDDESCPIKVEYEWNPVSCAKCCTFGHRCLDTNDAHVVQSTPATGDGNPSQTQGGWKTVGRASRASHSKPDGITLVVPL